MTLTYNTTFGTPLGQTQERINATFEYDQDFTGDTYNDIKVTLELESADNSGTEDMIGIAFDINNDAVSNLAIQNIQRSTENGTLSTFPPISYITTNGVPSNGQNAIPGFLVDVPADGIKFDVGIQFSDGGSGEGIVQSASFILTKPGTSIGKSLIENTDWYIRLQSTDGGAGSAKMGGVIGEISDAKPKIEINKVTNGVDNLQVLAGSDVTWTYTVTNPGNVALSNVLLTDDKQGQITNLTDGDNGNQQLDPGETWVYTATGTALPGNYSNLGTVTG
ncbi:MAG: hypothetical protein WB539_07720, partial [Planktothrix agardhii]|uniref:DUF7507 domain-containing protein n=1 Tax=Planktothrix agardhii TaxID=1160 RepID=UPI003C62C642